MRRDGRDPGGPWPKESGSLAPPAEWIAAFTFVRKLDRPPPYACHSRRHLGPASRPGSVLEDDATDDAVSTSSTVVSNASARRTRMRSPHRWHGSSVKPPLSRIQPRSSGTGVLHERQATLPSGPMRP